MQEVIGDTIDRGGRYMGMYLFYFSVLKYKEYYFF